MRLSCEGWFVISHLWRWELVQTATVRLGIDTLIANILVFLIFITVARDSGRLLYFGRVIYLFFLFCFPSTKFSTSLGRFSRKFATRRGICAKIVYLL